MVEQVLQPRAVGSGDGGLHMRQVHIFIDRAGGGFGVLAQETQLRFDNRRLCLTDIDPRALYCCGVVYFLCLPRIFFG